MDHVLKVLTVFINTLLNYKFRRFQIESVYRWQNRCDWKIEICIGKSKNIVGRGENAFQQYFQKISFSRS